MLGDNNKERSSSFKNSKFIYIPKTICVLSKYNMNENIGEILENIYLSSKESLLNPIESYIYKITSNVF